jgi:hypothetical protein
MISTHDVQAEDGAMLVRPGLELQPRMLWWDIQEIANERFSCVVRRVELSEKISERDRVCVAGVAKNDLGTKRTSSNIPAGPGGNLAPLGTLLLLARPRWTRSPTNEKIRATITKGDAIF